MDRTKRLFPDGIEQLGQNFRTVPPLLEWVNRVFGTVIAQGEEGVQPAYHELAPFRPEVREGPAVVVVGDRHEAITAAELRELEAADLGRLIVEMKVNRWEVEDTESGGCRPARFDDIAILVPTRTPLAQLERALDANDVPYRVESRSLVWATTPCASSWPCSPRSTTPPTTSPSWARCARRASHAPTSISSSGEPRAVGGSTTVRCGPRRSRRIHPVAVAMAALSRYHELRWELPVDQLVERVIRERKLVELTFALRRPRDHWRRLRFVLDQARAFVEVGGASLGDFTRGRSCSLTRARW